MFLTAGLLPLDLLHRSTRDFNRDAFNGAVHIPSAKVSTRNCISCMVWFLTSSRRGNEKVLLDRLLHNKGIHAEIPRMPISLLLLQMLGFGLDASAEFLDSFGPAVQEKYGSPQQSKLLLVRTAASSAYLLNGRRFIIFVRSY